MSYPYHPWHPTYMPATDLPSMERMLQMDFNRESSSEEGRSVLREQDPTDNPKKIEKTPGKKKLPAIRQASIFLPGHDCPGYTRLSRKEAQAVPGPERSAQTAGEGNYLTVDVSKIPDDAMKLQNTAVTRQNIYPQDLAPFIVHGHSFRPTQCQYQKPLLQPAYLPRTPQILWNFPTSYTNCVAPNVVAPSSIHPLLLYPNFPSMSLGNYMPPPCPNPPYQNRREAYPSCLGPQLPLAPRPPPGSADFLPSRSVYDIKGYTPQPLFPPPQPVYRQPLTHSAGYSGYRHVDY